MLRAFTWGPIATRGVWSYVKYGTHWNLELWISGTTEWVKLCSMNDVLLVSSCSRLQYSSATELQGNKGLCVASTVSFLMSYTQFPCKFSVSIVTMWVVNLLLTLLNSPIILADAKKWFYTGWPFDLVAHCVGDYQLLVFSKEARRLRFLQGDKGIKAKWDSFLAIVNVCFYAPRATACCCISFWELHELHEISDAP